MPMLPRIPKCLQCEWSRGGGYPPALEIWSGPVCEIRHVESRGTWMKSIRDQLDAIGESCRSRVTVGYDFHADRDGISAVNHPDFETGSLKITTISLEGLHLVVDRKCS